MIDHIQFQTTLTLSVIRISLAFQLILSSTHHHKPRICTGNDPVKIIGLDVGLKLNLFFGSAFDLSIYRIGFEDMKFGYAISQAMIVAVIIAVISITQIRFTDKKKIYD